MSVLKLCVLSQNTDTIGLNKLKKNMMFER